MMAIQAQLADGRVLEFPDGTNPAVIDRVVQNLLAEGKGAPASEPPYAEEKAAPPAQPKPVGAEAPKKPGAQPLTELRKGAMRAATSDLPSMWESVGILKDVGAAATVQERLGLFEKIDRGEITSLDQLRGLGMSTGQARSYFSTSPENRARMKERAVGELSRRKDLVDAAVKTIRAYQEDAKRYDPAVERPRDIGSVADFTNWVASTIGSGAVQIVPIMLAAATTGGVGLAAVGTAMGVAESVSNRLDYIQKQVKDLPPEQQAERIFDYIQKTGDASLLSGVISGAFDTVLGPAARLVKIRAGAIPAAATRREAAKREIKAVPKQMAGEAATGTAQEATQLATAVRLKEEEEFFNRENLIRLAEAAATEGVGSLGGAGINVGAAALRRPAGATEEAPPERIEPTLEETPPARAIPERVEPTLETRAAPPIVEPEGRIEPTLKRAPEVKVEAPRPSVEAQVAELKATMPFLGDDDIKAIVEAREKREQVKEEQRAAVEPPILNQPKPTEPDGVRLQEIFDDAVASGVPPEQALVIAQQQLAAEQQEVEGEPRVAEPVSPPSGESVSVAGVPDTGAPAGRPAGTERTGVVPTAADVGQPAVGEGEQPAPVDERPFEEIIRSTPSESLKTFIDPNAPVSQSYTSGEKKFIREELERRQSEAAGAEPDIGNVISMVERRQAQVEEQDEAEWERLEALSIEEGRAKLAETYGPQIKALWPIAQKTKKVLRESQDDKNSLEFQAATRIVRKLDELLDRFAGLEEETDTNGARTYFDVALTDIPAELATLDRALTGLQEPAVAPKGKRGRPKLERTEEQQAQLAEQKLATRRSVAKADYALKKLQKRFEAASTPIDEGDFETEEALKEAQSDQRAERRAAIRDLLVLSDLPELRGTAVQKRVKTALQDPRITPQEVADIRRGMEVAKKTLGDKGAVLSAFDEGIAPVNQNLSGTKNANQALTAIAKNGSPFQRIVAQRLRGLVNNTRFVVLEKDDPLPEELKAYEKDWNRANGIFLPTRNAIYVRGASFGRAQGANNVTALHEILHAATLHKIVTGLRRFSKDSPEYKRLQQFTVDLVSTMDLTADVYARRLEEGSVPIEVQRLVERTKGEVLTDPTEFLAYGMTDPDFQLFLMRVPGRIKNETAFSQFVRSLMRLFGIGPKDYSAFSDLINITDSILSERLQPSKQAVVKRPALQRDEKLAEQEGIRSAKELKKDMDKALEGLRKSKASEFHKHQSIMQKLRDQNPVGKAIKAIYSEADYKTKEVLARAVSFDFLARWKEKELPMIKEAYEVVQKTVGHMHDLREAAVSQVQMLDRDFKKDKELEEKLNDILPLTTIMGVDPSNPRSLEKEPRLTKMYEALGDVGKAAYKRIIDFHANLRDYQEYLLDKVIKDLPGLDEDTKRNMLAQIYKKFQEERRIEPYLPLVRDSGDFWLAVGEGDKTQIYVYETRAQRQEDAERMAREDYGGKPLGELLEGKEFAMINEIDELRGRIDLRGTMLSQLFDAIDKRVPETPEQEATLAKANAQLKNDMFDIWLSVMPEQAFRKQFHHRKNRAGYRPDIRRNIATHISRVAPALARLRYGQDLRRQQERIRVLAREQEELTPFKKSLDERINGVLAPKGPSMWDSVAGAANKLTYLTYLTGAATAFLQPMSIYISALPILVANHGANPVRVAKELGKMGVYMKQYSIIKQLPDGSTKYTAPTLANNKTLPEDERRAIRAMTSMNVSQQTYSGFLWDAAKGLDDDIVKGKGAKAADLLLNALLRNTERLTREAVYLAAYRLGRQRGLSEQDAILQAASDVKESLGDYDMMNRPAWMQGPLGRVIFSMKMYPLVVTQQLFGNMYRMIPFLNKEGKKQAFLKFSGIVMTTASLAGIYNMPFADLLITMLTKFLEEQDEDELPEGLEDKDPVLWFKTVWMPEKLGSFSIGGVPLDEVLGEGPLTALTGRAVGQRIGLNDLWFRDGKPSPDLTTAVQSFMFSFFPLASYGTSVLKAYEDLAIGDYQKAMERTVPLATARNFLIASRIKEEGFETPKGAIVSPEDVTTADIVWQGMGFSPADVAAARDTSFKLTGAEQKVLNQRNQIVRKLKFAHRKVAKDPELFIKVISEDIPKFNAKNPEYALEEDQLMEILETQAEQRAESRAGVSVTEKTNRLFGESVLSTERRLERRQEK